jgi:hypothetical protein
MSETLLNGLSAEFQVTSMLFHHYFINTAYHQYYAEQSNAETERDRNILCPTVTSMEHLPKASRSVPVSIKFGSLILQKLEHTHIMLGV